MTTLGWAATSKMSIQAAPRRRSALRSYNLAASLTRGASWWHKSFGRGWKWTGPLGLSQQNFERKFRGEGEKDGLVVKTDSIRTSRGERCRLVYRRALDGALYRAGQALAQ